MTDELMYISLMFISVISLGFFKDLKWDLQGSLEGTVYFLVLMQGEKTSSLESIYKI